MLNFMYYVSGHRFGRTSGTVYAVNDNRAWVRHQEISWDYHTYCGRIVVIEGWSNKRNWESIGIGFSFNVYFFLKIQITLKCGGNSLGEISCCVFAPSVFFTISKVNEASNYVLVHRSESVTGPDPTWKPITISMRSLYVNYFILSLL